MSEREQESTARERRNRALLGHLAAARKRGDLAGASGADEQLFRPLWLGVRAQAAAALRPSTVQEGDLDDIAIATMMRLLSALGGERDRTVPFRALVAKSVEFEVRDYRRKRARRAAYEELRDPTEMPEPLVAEQTPVPIEQTDALRATLVVLSPRDRQIVIEREVLDMPVALVAERHQMTPDAVRQACSRALARLRKSSMALLSSFPQTFGCRVTKPTKLTIKRVEESKAGSAGHPVTEPDARGDDTGTRGPADDKRMDAPSTATMREESSGP